jgi:serine/threonine protein kinase
VHDEVEIMHKIHHQHCVQLVEMFETKKKIWMVMEILTGGELFDRIVAKVTSAAHRNASAYRHCLSERCPLTCSATAVCCDV